MLAKLRPHVSPVVEGVARRLAALPAHFYTIIGVVASAAYVVASWLGEFVFALLLLLLSGLMDAVDGAVARVRGEASSFGALLDSVTDRVSDVFYGVGLLFLGFEPLLVYAFTVSSLLVSYTRARYEALTGKSMEGVGVMERSDRVIALAIVLALYIVFGLSSAQVMLLAVTVATVATFIERFFRSLQALKSLSNA